jgi:hypothetical protein
MNRLFITTLIACLIIKLISSCAANKLYEKEQTSDTKSGGEKTTSGFNSPIKIDPFNLNILPPSSGIHFYKDGIVFLSQTKNEGKMVPGQISFGILQAYYSVLEDPIPGPFRVFSPTITFKYPCEALTFSNYFNTMYFTRISESDKLEKIYHAEFSADENNKPGWKLDIEPLDFCMTGSVYSHPSVSSNGNTMIFASNNPKSIGGMDLFIAEKVGERWTEPKNLGDAVNTTGNELFPFLDNNKNLFFSSDGIPGNGGYDIFTSKFNGTGWDKAVNLTNLINSDNDEIAFSIDNKDGKIAFFTSKHKRNGEMQLYMVRLKDEINSKNLSGVLYSMAISEIETNQIKIAERNLAAEKLKADSLEAERIKKEKLKADSLEAIRIRKQKTEADINKNAKLKADSLEAIRIQEQRIIAEKNRIERLKADSIAALRMEALRIEAYNKEKKDIVIYKVQFISSPKPTGISKIIVNGESYKSSEYFYLGEYRYTIGEFTALPEARELQSASRKSGYPQAFVVAFKNNVRINDPDLFK